MSQHGIAVAAVVSNSFGHRLEFCNTAFGKRLLTRRSTHHLVHGHVHGSKETGVKLLRQQLFRRTHLQVLCTDLGILLGAGQNLINHVVEQVQGFWRQINLAQVVLELGHGLRINLRGTR